MSSPENCVAKSCDDAGCPNTMMLGDPDLPLAWLLSGGICFRSALLDRHFIDELARKFLSSTVFICSVLLRAPKVLGKRDQESYDIEYGV